MVTGPNPEGGRIQPTARAASLRTLKPRTGDAPGGALSPRVGDGTAGSTGSRDPGAPKGLRGCRGSRVAASLETGGHSPLDDQPKNWRATDNKTSGHQPKNWTGRRYFLTLSAPTSSSWTSVVTCLRSCVAVVQLDAVGMVYCVPTFLFCYSVRPVALVGGRGRGLFFPRLCGLNSTCGCDGSAFSSMQFASRFPLCCPPLCAALRGTSLCSSLWNCKGDAATVTS